MERVLICTQLLMAKHNLIMLLKSHHNLRKFIEMQLKKPSKITHSLKLFKRTIIRLQETRRLLHKADSMSEKT